MCKWMNARMVVGVPISGTDFNSGMHAAALCTKLEGTHDHHTPYLGVDLPQDGCCWWRELRAVALAGRALEEGLFRQRLMPVRLLLCCGAPEQEPFRGS